MFLTILGFNLTRIILHTNWELPQPTFEFLTKPLSNLEIYLKLVEICL
jgi:hypothetical protein